MHSPCWLLSLWKTRVDDLSRLPSPRFGESAQSNNLAPLAPFRGEGLGERGYTPVKPNIQPPHPQPFSPTKRGGEGSQRVCVANPRSAGEKGAREFVSRTCEARARNDLDFLFTDPYLILPKGPSWQLTYNHSSPRGGC
jgi:hypothetical protein